jgi:hypothetical protein
MPKFQTKTATRLNLLGQSGTEKSQKTWKMLMQTSHNSKQETLPLSNFAIEERPKLSTIIKNKATREPLIQQSEGEELSEGDITDFHRDSILN